MKRDREEKIKDLRIKMNEKYLRERRDESPNNEKRLWQISRSVCFDRNPPRALVEKSLISPNASISSSKGNFEFLVRVFEKDIFSTSTAHSLIWTKDFYGF